MTESPSNTVEPPPDLTKCPICAFRMGMLSRKEDYIVLGCDKCQVSMSIPWVTWERLTTRRMA